MGKEPARGTGLPAVITRISRGGFGLSAACVAALAMVGCASTPPDQDPVQIKLNDLDTRLTRIERVLANQSLLDLANQNEALRADLRSMHNDIDQLTNSLEAGRKQQRDLYADLDRRMKALESHGAPPASSAASAPPGAGDGGAAAGSNDKDAYQSAFALLKDSQYDRAIGA